MCSSLTQCYHGENIITVAMMASDEQVQMMSIEERRFVAEPTEVLEDVPLEEGNPEKFTRIGTSME